MFRPVWDMVVEAEMVSARSVVSADDSGITHPEDIYPGVIC